MWTRKMKKSAYCKLKIATYIKYRRIFNSISKESTIHYSMGFSRKNVMVKMETEN